MSTTNTLETGWRRRPVDEKPHGTERSRGGAAHGEAPRAHLCGGADDEGELHSGGRADGDAGDARAGHDVLRRVGHRLLRNEGGVADLEAAEAAEHQAEGGKALRLEDAGGGGEVEGALRNRRE